MKNVKNQIVTKLLFLFILINFACFSQTKEELFNLKQHQAIEFFNNGKYEEAIPLFQVCFNEIEKIINANDLKVNLLNYLFISFQQIKNTEKAIYYQLILVEVIEANYNILDINYALLLNSISLNYSYQSDFNNGLIYNQRCIDILEKMNKSKELIYFDAISNQANIYYNLGFINEALDIHLKNLKRIESNIGKENDNYLYEIYSISELYKTSRNYNQAIKILTEGRIIAEKKFGKSNDLTLKINSSLSSIYNKIGKPEKALDIEIENKILIEKIYGQNSKEYLLSEMNLVEIFLSLKQFDNALFLQDKIMKTSEAVFGKMNANHIANLDNSAYLLILYGLYDETLDVINKSLELKEKIYGKRHPVYLISLERKSTIYFFKKQYTKSLNIENEILISKKKIYGENSKNYASSLENILFLYINAKHFFSADSIFNFSNRNKTFYNYQFGLTENESIKNLQTEYQNLQFNTNYSLYRYQDNKALLQVSINRLINYKTLNLNILKSINKEISIKKNPVLDSLFTTWKLSKMQLVKYYELSNDEREKRGINLKEEEEASNLLEQQLSLNLETFKDLKKEYYWQDIQANLNKDEVYIEFFRLPGYSFDRMESTDSVKYLAYILKKESVEPEFVVFENGNDLENDLFDEYASFSFGSDKFQLNTNSFIHYWKPLQEKIGTNKTVFVALDGVFNKINFNTLYDSKTQKYLFETYDIQYVTNTIDFIKNKNKQKENVKFSSAILFGNPNFDYAFEEQKKTDDVDLSLSESRDLPDFLFDSLTRGMKALKLPGTKIEIQKIDSLFKSKNIPTTVFVENNASEEELKKCNSPSILHIATHGYFIADEKVKENKFEKMMGFEHKQFVLNPLLRSGILLSGANNTLQNKMSNAVENGLLTSYEASYLNLENTELVVLSACETGLGKIINGNGVYGLRKSIKDAGAKNIIMSLWKVDDKVTQEFMTTFYTFYLSGLAIKEVFSKTQTLIKSKYPQPYYWGAFILVEN